MVVVVVGAFSASKGKYNHSPKERGMASLLRRRLLLGEGGRRAKSMAAIAPVSRHSLPEYTDLTTLSNGMRVATERCHGECETATVGVWIDAGSRYEVMANNGVAHFLEHMAFKGTKNQGQRAMEVMVEDMGAHLNAYTSREQTVYYAKVFKSDVDRGMEVLADILQNSKLELPAIEAERGVILREMEEVNKIREELILDLLHEAAFRGGGLGLTILGPEDNIRTINRQDLENYVKTHYTAPRMVVAAAGNVDHEEICSLSEKYWSHVPRFSQTDFAVDFDTAKYTPTEIRVQTNSVEEPLAHVAIAYEGATWTDEASIPLMIVQTMIGQWNRLQASSGPVSPYPLARAVSTDDTCHSYLTFNTSYKDAGLFGIYFVCPPDGVAITLERVQTHLASLSEPGTFRDFDVERAKAQVKASIMSHLDSMAHVCEEIGRQILTYDRRMPIVEILARIDAVSPQDVTETAAAFMKDKPHAMASFGSIGQLQSFRESHISNFS